jgi:hypothetical protein
MNILSFNSIKMAALVVVFGFSASASASLITNGFTFAVASAGNDQSVGTHYHSNTGGAFGNPAGKAEVGRFSTEEVRGLSEYDLTGQSSAISAFVTFNVFKAGGLFSGTNDTPFTGTILVEAYAGNNLENISDYQSANIGSVGSFATTGLLVGNILSFDITSIFNAAILASDTSLGIRLQAVPLNPNSQAWTFDNFRLTTDNQSTAVPEPETLALISIGLIGLSTMRRRNRVS